MSIPIDQLSPYYFCVESPWGWWQVQSTDSQLQSVDYLPDGLSSEARTSPETRLEKRLDCMLSRYFKGDQVDFTPIPVDFSNLSPFSQEVLSLLRTVSYGQVQPYQWLANAMNKPGATRAVGRALGGNPCPIVVPCHRIISKSGSLGGFMRNAPVGSSLKTSLLALEGVTLPR